MIPLSNGRSPRIDQFYATLRTYKSHQFQEDRNTRIEQDKSIEHIKSLGKQIFEESRAKQTRKISKQNLNSIHRSHQSLVKPLNLYDKYKNEKVKKNSRQINRTKQIIIKEELERSQNQIKPNKKYDQIGSKIQKKGSNLIKGLNYTKKVDIEAQKIKKQKIQSQRIERQIKQHQLIFQRSNQSIKIKKQQENIGVLKRGEQMKARKQDTVQKIRRQRQVKQMIGTTFHPHMVSKKIIGIEPRFQKRLSMTMTQRTFDQKKLIRQAIQQNSFSPQLNLYSNSKSKIQSIWKQEKGAYIKKNGKNSVQENTSLMNTHNSSLIMKGQSQTANSTLQINLKDVNEISFIFE